VFDPLAVILLVSANRLLESPTKEADVLAEEKQEDSITDESTVDRVDAPTQESSIEPKPAPPQPDEKFKPHSLHDVWRISKRKK
jgi:hypothetical protein